MQAISTGLLAALICGCSFDGDTPNPMSGINTDADPGTDADTKGRVGAGLIALYTFDGPVTGEVPDVSGFGSPLDLAVVGNGNYEVTADGWNLTGDTLIQSKAPALKLAQECSQTNAITIEAWIRPASDSQTGPARILGMSADPYFANFTLAQGANNGNPDSRFNARLRTANDDSALTAVTRRDEVTTDWTHVVFTRAADESSDFYINSEEVELRMGMSRASFPGALSNWDTGYTLNLGDELESDGSRVWHGEYALVAIYRRALSTAEVSQNFEAGR